MWPLQWQPPSCAYVRKASQLPSCIVLVVVTQNDAAVQHCTAGGQR